MTFCSLLGFLLESLQVASEKFDRQLALYSADGFLHVVGNGLGKIPVHPRKLAERLVHGRDQVIFGLELAAPLGARQKIHEKFGVVEAAGVAAIVRASHLADDLGDLGKIGQHPAGFLRQIDSRRRPGARGQGAAHPNGAFIEMGQELGADDAAKRQEQHQGGGQRARAQGEFGCGRSTSRERGRSPG